MGRTPPERRTGGVYDMTSHVTVGGQRSSNKSKWTAGRISRRTFTSNNKDQL